MKKIDFRIALPNFITIIGLCLGLNSIKLAFEGNFQQSIIFILLAAILDAADGRIARLINGTSKFGAELDSLTDFVNFGVCPSLLVYFWSLSNIKFYGWIITLIFVVSCCLRLARFNLDTESNQKNNWRVNFFSGVPAPAGAVLILMPMIVTFSEFDISFVNHENIVLGIVILTSFLMISKIPTYAVKKIKISKSFFILLVLVLVLFFGLLFNRPFETLTIIGLIYFILIPVSFFHYMNLKKTYDKKIKKGDSIISDELF